VLDLFGMTHFEASKVQRAASNLLATKNNSALIKLLTTFQHAVDWNFAAIVKSMAASKDWASAELLIRTFETDEGDKSMLDAHLFHACMCFVS
jgi:hypothetical protein